MRVAEFLDILESGKFGIVSAPEKDFHKLVLDLVGLAQHCNHIGQLVIVDGRYDGVDEKSVLVPGLTDMGAETYGRIYEQESVLNGHRGLIFTDGSKQDDVARVKSQDTIEVLSLHTDEAHERLREFDNGSVAELHDGYVLFSLGLDF